MISDKTVENITTIQVAKDSVDRVDNDVSHVAAKDQSYIMALQVN